MGSSKLASGRSLTLAMIGTTVSRPSGGTPLIHLGHGLVSQWELVREGSIAF